MAKLFNRAKMTTSTTGSGTVTLGSASVGYQSFADAGVSNGDVVQYVIEEGGNFEIGTGTYSATGTSLTRSPTESSNSGAAISLSGAATVSITAVADDLNRLQHAGSTKVEPTSTGATVTGNLAVTGTVDGRDVAADGTKLDGIESGATADQTAAEIRTLVESATDSNVFTDADHTKLNGIESGATADQTASEIRSLVESATDSNVFTDADHTKLNGIESGATADQTAAEILTAIKTVDGSGSGLDADTLDGSHASAFLTGNQTITLTGDASGSGTTSINVTVANDSHTHDGRYYTETEADSRFVNVTGDTVTGQLTVDNELKVSNPSSNTHFNYQDTGVNYIRGNTYMDGTVDLNNNNLNDVGNLTVNTNINVGGTVDGRDVATDGAKLDGIASGATNTSAPNNATITLTAGTGLSGGGNFTTDQSTNETITFNLSTPYTYIDTATGQYGTVKVDDDRGVTWAGWAIRDDWVFMSNGAAEAGIYNDTDNDWAIKFAQNGSTSLQYNGSTRFQTESAGASAPAGLRVGNSGNPHNADALEINTATDEHIVLSGSTNPYIRWQEGTTDKAYIQWNATQNALSFRNQETDNFDFYPDSSTGAISLRLKGTDGDQWGVVYATDSQEIGFLDEGGSWAYRIANDSSHEWRITNGVEMSLNTSELNLSGNNINNVTNMYVANAIYHYGDTNTYLAFGTDEMVLTTGGSSEVTINTTGVRLGDTGNGYFQPVSGNYGSVQIDGGSHGGYEGYSIGGRAVFMHDNNVATGIFNDVGNHWLFYGRHSSYTRMYFNGSHKVETTNTGVTVVGDLNSTSDIRYKKNIETIDSALEKVQSLRGVTFDWDNDAFEEKENTKKPNFTERATGVIAQDVEKVLPEAVRENEDGFKNVAYGNMVGLLIEAIKEQQQQIDALKAQLNG